jgi:hypothetical protein
MHTKLHEDWYRRQSSIKAAMLVLLLGGIYDARRWYGLMWHDIVTKFHEDW